MFPPAMPGFMCLFSFPGWTLIPACLSRATWNLVPSSASPATGGFLQIPLVLDIPWEMHCLEIFDIYYISRFEKKKTKQTTESELGKAMRTGELMGKRNADLVFLVEAV